MKPVALICAALLFIAVANLPIGYYTFLRIIISIGAAAIIIYEFENGLSLWIIVFGLILILFNPLMPIYLNDKKAWIPIDIICGLLFFIKTFNLKAKTK